MIIPEKISGRLGNKMFQIAYLYAQVRDGIIPDVYVQDYWYFEKYADDIKKLFGEGIGYLGQVGVHVRRGKNPIDPSEPAYKDNPFYVNLCEETTYYQEALKLFPDDNFIVFTDDILYTKEYMSNLLPKERYQIMDKNDEVDDLNLMASCKGLIGANSSYSWWAGFLNPNPSARIVFPSVKNWYKDGIERTVCPKEWIRI